MAKDKQADELHGLFRPDQSHPKAMCLNLLKQPAGRVPRCCLKGGSDSRLSGVWGEKGDLTRETAETLRLDSGC